MGARRVGPGRLAGPGWRRLPGRHEVAIGRVRGRGARGPLRRRERRRGGARDVQGSAVVAREPVSGPRGAVGRRDRRRRTRSVHRGEGVVRAARSTRSNARCARWPRRICLCDAPVSLIGGPEEYLFGEEKALLEVIEGNDPMPRWLPPYVHGLYATTPQEGWSAGTGPAAVRRRARRVESDAGDERRDARQRAVDPDARRRLVSHDRYRRHAGTVDLHGRRRRDARRFRRDRARHHVARGDRPRRRRCTARSTGEGGVVGGVESGARVGASRRARQLRGPGRGRRWARIGRLHRLRRHAEHGCSRTDGVTLPVRRVVRPVPCVQVRMRRDHAPPRSHRRRARRRRATSSRSESGCSGSPTRTAASSAKRNSA